MYCITLIPKDGSGGYPCLGYSKSDCRKKAQSVLDALSDQYVVATVPYELRLTQSKASKLRVEWDTKVPELIRKGLGMKLRLLLDKELSLE